MQKINQKYINGIVKKALNEDLKPDGDITTNLLNSKSKKINDEKSTILWNNRYLFNLEIN